MTTERNKILTSNRNTRNTSQGRTHVISGKSNNTTLQWTRTDVKVSKRTTNTYSTGGLFSTETVISSNGMYSFFSIFIMKQKLIRLNISKGRENHETCCAGYYVYTKSLKKVITSVIVAFLFS